MEIMGQVPSMMKNDKERLGAEPAPGRQDDPLGTNSEIGRKLKQFYDGIVSEEIPDRFQDLLRALDAADKKVPRP